FSKVIPYAEQALRYSRNMINPDGVLQSANLLSLAYEQTGDYKNALRYHKLHTAQQDSLNRLRVKKEYVDALSRFETEQKETRITILEQENRLQSLERNVILGILVVVLLGVGAVYVRSKEIRNIEVARHAETLQRNFSEQLLAQQEQERKRISTELHDSLGQNLLIIKNMLDISIQTKMPKHALNQQLGELSEIASRSIEETRAIASNLHPYQLNRMGLTKALIAMMRNLEQSTKISLFHSIDKAEGIFSKDTEAHLYRIVQESVNNVLKHSNATELRVELRNNGQHIRISISDNGNGFDASSVEQKESLVGGLGLFGLKERARIIGGRLSIHSAIGSGTTVEVVVPV
ncbi:MAG: sensor histidine kinase, partial [Bacteroidetes bacterium]|nr:sensor histidine kinase [Bacteroidota bacterium]